MELEQLALVKFVASSSVMGAEENNMNGMDMPSSLFAIGKAVTPDLQSYIRVGAHGTICFVQ